MVIYLCWNTTDMWLPLYDKKSCASLSPSSRGLLASYLISGCHWHVTLSFLWSYHYIVCELSLYPAYFFATQDRKCVQMIMLPFSLIQVSSTRASRCFSTRLFHTLFSGSLLPTMLTHGACKIAATSTWTGRMKMQDSLSKFWQPSSPISLCGYPVRWLFTGPV